jgi:hypothetical protein
VAWLRRLVASLSSRRAGFRAQASPCGIYGGQSDTGPGLSPSSSVSPVDIIAMWLSILMYHQGYEQQTRR